MVATLLRFRAGNAALLSWGMSQPECAVRRRLVGLVIGAIASLALVAPAQALPDPGDDACGLMGSQPAWVDYGEASLRPDVRAVFGRPGVTVSTSGAEVPRAFREQGAKTAFWVMRLPRIVGTPNSPADSASIPAAAADVLKRARTSTDCATPWITLNELFGADQKTPWSPSIAQYRANVLTLMRELRAGGAYPFLLVHGVVDVAGDAAEWWRQVAGVGDIVYEAYYDAPRISALGVVLGNRRIRLGMRGFVKLLTDAGVPAEKVGFMLGFHSAQRAGIGGRQGLQPREEWLRIVKWEALGARQVAADEGTSSIWSWGWGTFGPGSVDADKAGAACVYLWARDAGLCDGPTAGGPGFISSVDEGQILLGEAYCAFPGGYVTAAAVDEITSFAGGQHAALTALFARLALGPAVPITDEQVLAHEAGVIAREFGGSEDAYARALERRGATVEIARDVIRDELRRRAIRRMIIAEGLKQTPLEWANELESDAVATAICRRDDLPGYGDFPRSNERDVGVVPLLAKLRFLTGDRKPPRIPAALAATSQLGAVTLGWAYGVEQDLAGYAVFRAARSGGSYVRLNKDFLLARPTLVDTTAPEGQSSFYVVRAVDTSGHWSAGSAEVGAVPGSTPPPGAEPEETANEE